jgi:hypothetical protein
MDWFDEDAGVRADEVRTTERKTIQRKTTLREPEGSACD